MIAADSSVLIPWLEGRSYPETERLAELVRGRQAALAPVTVTEVFSGPQLSAEAQRALGDVFVLELVSGVWMRAGLLRAQALRIGRKARLADTLIAQFCIDAGVPLLTRDSDFRIFVELGGLELA